MTLRGVGKQFAGVRALDGVDLDVARGTVHALVGENGAGKSTLGKLISGVHAPDAGSLAVDGEPVSLRSPRDALARGITTIAQEISLLPERSVVENVFLGIGDHRAGVVRTRALRERFARLAESVGFELPADEPVRRLRLADQQKVELLRAVARSARLIVMDEPTAALGAEDAARLLETVRRLRDDGTTIVFVSHFLDDVLALADTVSVLRDGRMIQTTPAAGLSSADLVTAMLGRTMTSTFPPKRPPAPDAPVVFSVSGLASAAVSEISFEIRAGEIVGLSGLVGSGRSEVAHALFGADRRSAGTLQLDGRAIAPRSPAAAVREGIALLPESRKSQGLMLDRSTGENVVLPHLRAVARGGVLTPRRERRAVAPLLERLDVRGDVANQPVTALSGGNQQKALFAKWLLRPPRLLIVDEPTRGVDVGAKRSIYELLAQLAADGMPILLISSELEEILGLAHRVLVMRGGRIVAEHDGELSEDALMRSAFGSPAPSTLEGPAT